MHKPVLINLIINISIFIISPYNIIITKPTLKDIYINIKNFINY